MSKAESSNEGKGANDTKQGKTAAKDVKKAVSFGLLVFDHSNTYGKVIAQNTSFYNEAKQSVFNADEQSKCVANNAMSKAESSNEGKGMSCSANEQKKSEAEAKDGVENQATNGLEQ